MPYRTRRAFFAAVVFLSACGLAGSYYGRVSAQSATDQSNLRDGLKQFTDAYSIVEQNYADKLDTEKTDKAIYDGAIPGMLHVLDPHSNFYDPKSYAQMREDTHGRYYGVGMIIQPHGSQIVVLTPFEGTPSFRAGVKPGDVILSVDGKATATLDSTAVANMLKGPRGTHVTVTMEREGSAKPLTFDLVRDEIPRPSVDIAFLIKPNVGYIHITQFMETTSREVGEALDKFGPNMQGLLIDLRDNPGGLLNEAVNVSDKFLQKGQVVVSQRGRAFPEQVYRAPSGSDQKYPVVVLVNRNTASAAEIVSGALQDHDRALIVGETTFGKGLVQIVFPLAENTGLALTTYHYYTPSGRLIQRNYEGVSLYDYYYGRHGALPANNTNQEVKATDSGRTVYGGGGITPDEKIDSPKADRLQENLLVHYAFANFAKHYLATRTINKDFTVDEAAMQAFKAYLKAQNIDYTDQDIATDADWIRSSIKEKFFTYQFGQAQGLVVAAQSNPAIQKALTFMPEAQALENHELPSQKKPVQTASR